MTPLETGGLTLFILVLLFGIFSILFGFPGTVIILMDAAIYAAFTGFDRIGAKTLLTLLILSILAEVTDFALGMAGAVKFGASRKSYWSAAIGGVIGAALLIPFLLGLGAVAGAFFGGLTGVLILELLRQNRLKPALRAFWGSILGRAAGIFLKGVFALMMAVITLTGVYS